MAVNVTQKDKTLTEIIRHCEESADVWASMPGDFSSGYHKAMTDVVAYCRERLGYTGVMPLGVPNQSKQAKEPHLMAAISHSDGWGKPLCDSRYECSCGYWTYNKDEAEAHFKENS